MDKLVVHVGWDDVKASCFALARQIIATEWKPSMIIGLARGGLPPACLLAQYLGIPRVHSIGVCSYYNGQVQGELDVYQNVSHLDINGQDILLVDDLLDSGFTVTNLLVWLGAAFPKTVKVAVLYQKEHSKLDADFKVYAVKSDAWLSFPWEV